MEKEKGLKIREELKECDGVSKSVFNVLKNNKKSQKLNHLKEIHKLLSVSPPELPEIERNINKIPSEEASNGSRKNKNQVERINQDAF